MIKRKNHSTLLIVAAIFLLTVAAAACNTEEGESSLSLIGEDGKHAAGWVETHGSVAGQDVATCETCHGSLSDPLPTGGISGVSCFEVSFNGQSCHGSGESFHPADWVGDHGEQAKPDGADCTSCHGSDLDGGISNVSCYAESNDGQACHIFGPAFHPASWLNKSSRGTSDWHADAYQSNLLINRLPCETCHTLPALTSWPDGKCVQCHFDIDGARSPDSSWTHGTAPHDQFLDTTEADVCVSCHEVNNGFGHGPSFTDCYDCHGIHPPDWANPTQHGGTAKAQPQIGSDTGFFRCQECHGDDFSGGRDRSCSGTECHETFNLTDAIPHPSNWSAQSTDIFLHQANPSTDPANAPVCAQCHLDGDNSPLSPPSPPVPGTPAGCFNNTLCHGDVSHGVPFLDHYTEAANLTDFNTECSQCHSVTGTQPDPNASPCDDCHSGGSPYTYGNCSSCHGNPPDNDPPVGNVFPNRDGEHTKHHNEGFTACNTCHTGGGTGTGLDHGYNGLVDLLEPAGEAINFTTGTNVTCANDCHGEDHQNEEW